MDKFYVTTPIYYVNDVPHIGHAYTTIIADTLARYNRIKAKDVFFLTGTDEHGQKIEQAAHKRGKSPKEYADEISSKFKNLWDEFEISYDKYIRTTDEYHKQGVQKAFLKMFNKGDIYKGEYEGHYCVSCETYFTEAQLVDNEFCPECGKTTTLLKEESYFFKLSKYEKPLLKWIEKNPNAILPKSRRNEVIRFIEQGLEDLSITRTSFEWGVKLPDNLNDPKHIMYVWLDALMNYLTALGYGEENNQLHYWPADVHLIGKDILRFHAIFWPAFLMSLEEELPKCIAAHGWWTRDGQKMSKSKGNVINPKEVADAYGIENFRYFMLREVPFGQDGDFAQKALIGRINNDLGNDLGNLLNRIIGMGHKYFDANISSKNVNKYFKDELDEVDKIISSLDTYMTQVQLNKYLEELWRVISIGNKTIESNQPWAKIKQENGKEEVEALLGFVANILAKTSIMLYAIMPNSMQKLASSLKIEVNANSYKKFITNHELLDDFVIEKIPPLFPKIETSLMQEVAPKKEEKKKEESEAIISIDEFFKTTIKVGKIIEAKELKKSKKLLVLMIDIGENKPRQVVAGIKEYYVPDELIGTKICLVSNLKPAKIMGIESNGMVLATKDENTLRLVRPDENIKVGTKVS